MKRRSLRGDGLGARHACPAFGNAGTGHARYARTVWLAYGLCGAVALACDAGSSSETTNALPAASDALPSASTAVAPAVASSTSETPVTGPSATAPDVEPVPQPSVTADTSMTPPSTTSVTQDAAIPVEDLDAASGGTASTTAPVDAGARFELDATTVTASASDPGSVTEAGTCTPSRADATRCAAYAGLTCGDEPAPIIGICARMALRYDAEPYEAYLRCYDATATTLGHCVAEATSHCTREALDASCVSKEAFCQLEQNIECYAGTGFDCNELLAQFSTDYLGTKLACLSVGAGGACSRDRTACVGADEN